MDDINEPTDLEKTRGVSRRTVAKGVAWAVPAITLATAVPAAAGASQGVISFSGAGCKIPGGSAPGVFKGYVFRMTASNTTSAAVTVTITSATLDGTSLGEVTVIDLNGCQKLGNPFTIPANTNYQNLALLTRDAPNSQNGALVVTYTVSGSAGSETAYATAGSLPPIQGGCAVFTSAEEDCITNPPTA